MKRVQLGRIERTLNALTRANRKRNVSVLERMSEEAAVLDDAFTEVRDAVLEEAARTVEDRTADQSTPERTEWRHKILFNAAAAVRALKSDGGKSK